MNEHKKTLARIASLAKAANLRGDAVMRSQYAETWRELATESEASRAPKYLTWCGRK